MITIGRSIILQNYITSYYVWGTLIFCRVRQHKQPLPWSDWEKRSAINGLWVEYFEVISHLFGALFPTNLSEMAFLQIPANDSLISLSEMASKQLWKPSFGNEPWIQSYIEQKSIWFDEAESTDAEVQVASFQCIEQTYSLCLHDIPGAG